MRRFGTLLLAFVSSGAGAWIVQAPPTSSTAVTRARSTSVWTAKVTKAPAVHADLLRRDVLVSATRTAFLADTNVCGYLNGNSNSAVGCNVGYRATCGLFVDNVNILSSASQGAMGCCYDPVEGQTTSNCAVFTTCMEYSMLTTVNSCANYCGPSENILQCTDPGNPYCSSFKFQNAFTDAAPNVDFTGYMCAASPGGVAQGAYTTYVGQNTTMAFSTTTVLFFDTVSGSSTTGFAFSTASPSSSTPSSSPTSSPSTSSPATSSTATASPSATPIGPIVGGVVGGVVVLIAAASGIYFWRRKRRAAKSELPGDGAHSAAQVYPPHYPPQELNGPEFSQELAHKPYVAEVSSERGVHEVMGTEVYR